MNARALWHRCEIYVFALLIFALSRAVVVLGLLFGKQLVQQIDPTKWEAGAAWYDRLLRWDSGWYASILDHGYVHSTDPAVQGSTAFYPVYPLISYVVEQLCGVDRYHALLIVANVASVAVVLLLVKVLKPEMERALVLLTVALFCFFPWSMFLSAGYTESTYLLFALLSFVCIERRPLVASAFASLALGTRIVGAALIPAIWARALRERSSPRPQAFARLAAYGVVAVSSLIAFAIYLGIKFNAPLGFLSSQDAWYKQSLGARVFSAVTLQNFVRANPLIDIILAIFIGLIVWGAPRLKREFTLYAAGTILIPYVALGIVDSTPRFLLVCIPAFMSLAMLLRPRPWVAATVMAVFGAFLFRVSALFSAWYWGG